ncbi:uncharacterized protein LOC135709474 [Ochlerotatus camptorhynchus]|uniref:uncharacterized protein LOC135709474 n=1 Tax=Ochlerotatus camptorhynchus TaxID=644619 RepID=UPI0031DA069D
MFSFSADGFVIPPDVILPRKRFSRDVLRSFPGDWGLGSSENGWMNTHNFIMYIKKIFHPTLIKRGTKFPIIFFVDGHSSHIALEAADTCYQLGIILIALYPNATRILQPADVAIFRPHKINWGKTLDAWRSNHISEKMTLVTFGPLLEKTMAESFKKLTIINGFSACGLVPYNPDAVNFSKCIAKSTENQEVNLINGGEDFATKDSDSKFPTADDSSTEESHFLCTETVSSHGKYMETQIASSCPSNWKATLETHVLVPQDVINQAVEMLGQSKISLYLSEESGNMPQEDKVLSYIYEHILSLSKSDDRFSLATIDAFKDATDTYHETTDEPVVTSEIVEEGSCMETSTESNQIIVDKVAGIEMASDTIVLNDTTDTYNESFENSVFTSDIIDEGLYMLNNTENDQTIVNKASGNMIDLETIGMYIHQFFS